MLAQGLSNHISLAGCEGKSWSAVVKWKRIFFWYRSGYSTDMLCWHYPNLLHPACVLCVHLFSLRFVWFWGFFEGNLLFGGLWRKSSTQQRSVWASRQSTHNVAERRTKRQGHLSPQGLNREISFLKQVIFHLFAVSLQGMGFFFLCWKCNLKEESWTCARPAQIQREWAPAFSRPDLKGASLIKVGLDLGAGWKL